MNKWLLLYITIIKEAKYYYNVKSYRIHFAPDEWGTANIWLSSSLSYRPFYAKIAQIKSENEWILKIIKEERQAL